MKQALEGLPVRFFERNPPIEPLTRPEWRNYYRRRDGWDYAPRAALSAASNRSKSSSETQMRR